MRQLQEARQIGEQKIGRRLTETEYQSALSYAKHKAVAQGNGPDYVPFLLPDVIVERELEASSIAFAALEYKCGKEMLDRWKRLLGITKSQFITLVQREPELLRAVAAVTMPCAEVMSSSC